MGTSLKKNIIHLFNDLFNNNIHLFRFNETIGLKKELRIYFNYLEVSSYNIKNAYRDETKKDTIKQISNGNSIEYEEIYTYTISNYKIVKNKEKAFYNIPYNKITII